MANSQEIIDWSLQYSEQLHLKVEYYSGLEIYFPEICDIGIFIEINNEKYWGRGTDADENVAYCKALSEAIERSCLRVFDLGNSNGLAVHPDLNQAKENARNELIERDAFMSGFILGGGFKFKEVGEYKNLVSIFESIGVEISFFEMCSYPDGIGILVTALGLKHKSPFGYIMGSAFESNPQKAAYKALLELLRNLDHVVRNNDVSALSIEEFNQKESHKFHDHGLLAKNLEYAKTVTPILYNSNAKVLVQSLGVGHFEFTQLDKSRFPIENLPLFLVQSKNADLQQLFVGPTTIEKVNFKRMSSIVGKDVQVSTLNMMPHPFD